MNSLYNSSEYQEKWTSICLRWSNTAKDALKNNHDKELSKTFEGLIDRLTAERLLGNHRKPL